MARRMTLILIKTPNRPDECLAHFSAGRSRSHREPGDREPIPRKDEVWEIFNTTADVHPMHFHLVNVQVINRQPLRVSSLGITRGGVNFTGPADLGPA